MSDQEDLLTVGQLLIRLDIDRTTLYRLRKAGKGPVEYRLGKRKGIRFKPSDVDAWLDGYRKEQAAS